MRLFSRLYQRVIQLSKHQHAVFYLAGISFVEPALLAIPPVLMLMPMSLAKPDHVWRYATITLLFSILGALFGYSIGWLFVEWAIRWIEHAGYMPKYLQVQVWFHQWGGWVMFISGILPVPFRLFTISAGALQLGLLPFITGTLVSRAIRFYLLAAFLHWGGTWLDNLLRRFIEWIGWIVVLILAAYGTYHWLN